MNPGTPVPASFRDPSGFLFERDGQLYRQVNASYREHYDHLMTSGLYADLAGARQLVAHEVVDEAACAPSLAYRVLRPQRIPFISYPYEWSFGELKAAAELTLAIQRQALARGLTLKDASAYNVQFVGTRPVFIDTLSFEKYAAGQPWVAYRQFCQHFLAPLALMSWKDVRLGQLLRVHLDGVPLDLASSLLPVRTRLQFALLIHLHLHARVQKSWSTQTRKPRQASMSQRAMLGLIDNLQSAVRGLSWRPRGAEWLDYYEDNTYTAEAMARKKAFVAETLDEFQPRSVWDLGANTGLFSRLASERGITTLAFDSDPACVERMFLEGAGRGEERLLPLFLDLTNPSPAIGWANRERLSLTERGPADLVLALGLVHHLAIAGNVPLTAIASYLASLGRRLVIEFVPKTDPQVSRLLVSRPDIFPEYDQAHFESAFGGLFTLQPGTRLADSGRILYRMQRRDA